MCRIKIFDLIIYKLLVILPSPSASHMFGSGDFTGATQIIKAVKHKYKELSRVVHAIMHAIRISSLQIISQLVYI